jgi:hypothetical protein
MNWHSDWGFKASRMYCQLFIEEVVITVCHKRLEIYEMLQLYTLLCAKYLVSLLFKLNVGTVFQSKGESRFQTGIKQLNKDK